MMIWATAASILAAAAVVILILYRRQIRKICRHLSFMKEENTNMRLTSDLPFTELNELIDGMNDIVDQSRKIREDVRNNEAHLKETITNLSHDIRTPLTSLDGYFQFLLTSDSEEERQRYIRVIQTRIGSLKDMLEELFTYTRLQDAEYKLETEIMDFGKCVCDTVFSFYDEFQAKGIEPQADFCDGHLYIRGNEEAVRRAVQNLVKNALVHGKGRISLKLYCENERTGFECANDSEHPEEIDMNQVFSRFYRADSARTHSSAGLGLSIAKGLTERMGGTAEASLDGNLFTVRLEFPVDNPALTDHNRGCENYK